MDSRIRPLSDASLFLLLLMLLLVYAFAGLSIYNI